MPPVAPAAENPISPMWHFKKHLVQHWPRSFPRHGPYCQHHMWTTCGPHVPGLFHRCRPWINPEDEPVYERSICLRWTHTDTGRKLQYLRWQNRVLGVQWSQTEMKISLSSLSDTAAHGAAPLELRCRGVRVRVKSSSLFQLKVNFLKHKNQKQKKITETRTREFKSSLDNFVSSTPF